MSVSNAISQINYISSIAVSFSKLGRNDNAKDLEYLLSDLYEILFNDESNIGILSPNNADFDFRIGNKFYQVTIRDDGITKLNDLIKGIKNRFVEYCCAEEFSLIFFRDEKKNEKETLTKKVNAENFPFNFKILFLEDLINIFIKNPDCDKKYFKIIDKYYGQVFFYLAEQNGPEKNAFQFIERKLTLQSRTDEKILQNDIVIKHDELLNFDFVEGKHFVIHGDPASGKTSILNDLFYKCSDRKIPRYYFPLRNFRGQNFSDVFGKILEVPHSILLIDASDEVSHEFIVDFCKEMNNIFLSYKGRIIITVRSSCLEELKSFLLDSKYAVFKLNLLSKNEILDYSKLCLAKKENEKLLECIENGNTFQLARNPFYLQQIIYLIKEEKGVKSPYEIVKNTVEISINREYKNRNKLLVNKNDLLTFIEKKAFDLIKNGENSFNASEEQLALFSKCHLFSCDGNLVYFSHNVFKEYFCAVYLSKLALKDLSKHISLKINKKLFLIPRFSNVVPFLLDICKDNSIYSFVINNFPETVLNYPGLFISENDAIKIMNSVLNDMSCNKYWGDDSLFAVDDVCKFVFNENIRKEVIKYIDPKYFRTTIIYCLRLMRESTPVSLKLVETLKKSIDVLLSDSDYSNDDYLISCCLEVIAKLNVDLKTKKEFINKFISSNKNQVKHGVLTIIKDNELCDDFAFFISECSFVKLDGLVIDTTLDFISKLCIDSFKKQESFATFLDFYSKKIKENRHIHTYHLEKIDEKLCEFDNLDSRLINSLFDLFFSDDYEKYYRLFPKTIEKFNLQKNLFLKALQNESHFLYDYNFILEVFNAENENIFISNINKTPFLKMHIQSLLDHLKKNDIELYQKFYSDLDELKLIIEKPDYKYGTIQNKVFSLLFEQDSLKKIFKFFYDTIELDILDNQTIRNNRYSNQTWAEFPEFVYNLLRRNEELRSKNNIDSFSFCDSSIFSYILIMVDTYGCKVEENNLSAIKDYIVKWLNKNNEVCYIREGQFYIKNEFPSILSLILRYNIDLSEENYQKIIAYPDLRRDEKNRSLAEYFCEKIDKQKYIKVLKTKLINDELYEFKISEFLDFMSESKIYDVDIIDYLLDKIKSFADFSSVQYSAVNYLDACKCLSKTLSIFTSFSDELKKQILCRLSNKEKQEFAKEIKIFDLKINKALFTEILSCGRKDFLKSYITAVKKGIVKTGDFEIELSSFDFSAYKLVIAYYELVLNCRDNEGYFHNPIEPIKRYFLDNAKTINKTNKIICGLEKIYNNKKNETFSYYRTLEKEIANHFLDSYYKNDFE